jgi:predicted nucleic acid-binding protein
MDAFDADVLVYAAAIDHPLGRRVRALFPSEPLTDEGAVAGVGSVLLLPELLTKPLRDGRVDEATALASLLSRLDLLPVDTATAELAVALGAMHNLRAIDTTHLATAVAAGADRFITNNTRHFGSTITEIDIVPPRELADPTS